MARSKLSSDSILIPIELSRRAAMYVEVLRFDALTRKAPNCHEFLSIPRNEQLGAARRISLGSDLSLRLFLPIKGRNEEGASSDNK